MRQNAAIAAAEAAGVRALSQIGSAAAAPALGRRLLLAGGLAAFAVPAARADAAPTVRLGILPFGTVQWVADVIARHALDRAHGFILSTTPLANTEAAKVALMGHAVDIAVSDWPFVAAQRSRGGTLTFAPFSSSLGGILVPAGAGIRTLADLKGRKLGVAGGSTDKSWLIVRAAARKQGIDLAHEATLSFGAPPLLSAALQHGQLDALLTFWNFAARLQSAGFHEVITVSDCARELGLPAAPVLVGWVFDAGWADANRAAVQGFLAAAAAAGHIMASQPAEWIALRQLMQAPDDALFHNLRDRFLAGQAVADAATLEAQARQLQALIAEGNAPVTLPAGVFWHGA